MTFSSFLSLNFRQGTSSSSTTSVVLSNVMNISKATSSSFDMIINPYSEFLGLYGGGADDLVEHRGGGGIPSVNLMEELLGSLIPPRSSMSLLGAGLSSSMLRG